MNTRLASGVLSLMTAFLRAFLNVASAPRKTNLLRTNRSRFATPLGYLCLLATTLPLSAQYSISTLAGTGKAGFGGDNGPASAALLNNPRGIAVDSDGNVYIADQLTNRVRKVDRTGNITTVAGGTAAAATPGSQLNSPSSVAVDASGNLYIADQLNNRVRVIDGAGNISSVAGAASGNTRTRGIAIDALLNKPTAVAVDAAGRLYIAEAGSHSVTSVNASGKTHTLSDRVNDPRAVAVDAAGNVYIADTANSRILKIDMTSVVTTVAGTGTAGFAGDGGAATDAQLSNPQGVAVDGAGNLYIADTGNNRIRKIGSTGVITTVAGTGDTGFSGDGGSAASAQLDSPSGIATDAAGNVYVADSGNNRVRVLSLNVASDFDHNGVPDLVWQYDKSGVATLYYFGGAQGAAFQSWNYLNLNGVPGWHIVAIGDFNRDGNPDVVWQNDTTRQVTVYYYGGTGGTKFLGWDYLNYNGTLGWHVVGAADVNGDGYTDLIWQNDTTAAVAVNYYGGNGTTLTGWDYMDATGTPGWSVVAVADFNGDGVPDLVWQNDVSGALTVHYYGGPGGVTLQTWDWLDQTGVVGWHVKFAADFNGDGHPDLVWQNDITRQVTIYYYGGVGGTTFLNWKWLEQSSLPGWTIFAELRPSQTNNIALPSNLTLLNGQSVVFPVTLSSPAPAGGVTVTLSNGNKALLTLSTTSVFIAAGTTTPSTQPLVTGVGIGSVNISASAPGYHDASQAVSVQGIMAFTPSSLNLSGTTTQNITLSLTGVQSAQSLGAGFTVHLSSSNTSVATVPATATFPLSNPSVTIPVTTVGAGTATIRATGVPNFMDATATVTVASATTLTFSPANLDVTTATPQNITLTLSTPAPAGGLTVNLSSSNTAAATVPATATFPANATTISVLVTGVANGTAVLHASALPNIADITAVVTVGPPPSIGTPSNIVVGLAQSLTFPITLASPAPAGGVTITLTSADTTKLTVSPATVTIAQGATTPTTQPQVTGVNIGAVIVTAAAPGFASATQSVQVNTTVAFTPNTLTVTAGSTQNLTLTLATPAPAGGLTVNLSSANTSLATVPATASFAANATTVSIPVTGVASGSVVIDASSLPAIPDVTATVTVSPAGAIGIPANTTVSLGQSVAFAITLPAPAPPGGVTVTLASSDTTKVTVPASVVIPAGATTPATQPQVTGAGLGTANITATSSVYSQAVQPVQVNATVSFSPATANIAGTATQNLTLTLSAAAPTGGVTINLNSSNASVASVPSTVSFAAGATTVAVPITGVGVGSATIHASALPNIADSTATANVAPTGAIGIPSNTTVGLGQSSPFAITLPTPAGAGGVTVSLTTSDASKVTVPPSVLIPAGATTPTTQPQVNGINLGSATITASNAAYTSASQPVLVNATVSFSPAIATIVGTATQNLTLNLSAPAPVGGVTINLSSSNANFATVPATVTFAAGATTATVPVTGVAPGNTVIHASALPNIADATASVTVQSAGGIVVPSNVSVGIGQITPFAITLPQAAPAGGVSVTLVSSDTSKVTVFPTSVSVAAGATTPVSQPQVAGASLGSASITASAPGYSNGSQTVQVTATIAFSPGTISITGPTTQNATLTLSTPAPAGGLVINLSSSNTGVATTPATVTFPANAVTVNVPVTGVSIGLATIHASSLPNIPDTTAAVTVASAGAISIPSNATVGLGQSAVFPIAIANPAGTGGVTIMLASTDTTKVTITPASVSIAAGATTPATQPAVSGVNFGLATINAVAAGYTGTSQQVQTTASIAFSPLTLNITGSQVQNLALNLSAAAPAGGLTVNLSSTNPAAATVPASVTFAAGATSATVPVSGISIGSTIIHASASPNVADTAATVNVVSAGTIGLPANVSIGIGLTTPFAVTLPVPAPVGGVTIALTSGDTAKITISPATVFIAAGATAPATQPQVTAVSIGSASITASTTAAYTTAIQTVQVTASVAFTPGTMTIAGLNTQNITLTLSAPAPAGGLTVTLSSSNAGVASVAQTATFTPGASSIAVPVTALTLGSTVLHASALPNIADSTATVNIVSGGSISLPSNVTLSLGQSMPFIVALPKAAPPTGVTVTLSSSDSSKVSVTSTVSIAGGATTPVTQPEIVGANVGSASITATAPGFSSSTQTVQVAATIGFSPNSMTIVGTATQNLTLTLSGPAPATGLTVNLSSSNAAAATVPATATFAAGTTSVIVPVTGVAVSNGTVTIHASALPSLADVTANVQVTSPGGITVQSNVIVGIAHSASLTVTLPQPAPSGGVTVALTSSDPTKATVTSSVFITGGATTPATQPQVSGINLGSVTITATAPTYISGTQTVQVNAAVSFTPSTITITGPATQNITLTLSGAAPSTGLTLNLSSDNTGAATVPSTINFPAGSTNVTVPVTGVAVGSATIHASLLPNIADATAGASVVTGGTIGVPSNVSVVLAHSATFPISLPSAAPAGGITVTLTSSDTSKVTIAPMSVFIAAGALTPLTQPSVSGINLGFANITALASGYTSGTQPVTVGATLAFTSNNVTIIGPTTLVLTLTLSGSAPSGGLTVNLSSSNPAAASVPATVTFPSAATSASVVVSGVSIGSTVIHASALPNIADTIANVSVASAGVISLPDNLTVALSQSVTFPVVLPIAAPAGGTTVLLNSSDATKVTITPASVFIPAGAQVPATQPQVSAVNFGSVNITAAAPGYTAGTQTVQVNATATFIPASLTITGAVTQTMTLTLSAPAPSGGLTMNLSSSNSSVATVPATATFSSGATTANVQVTAITVGSTVIHASSLPYVADGTANVNVQSQIVLPSNLTMGQGQTSAFQVGLVSPAPSGGVFISLSSSDSSKVSISPANVFINQGDTLPKAAPQVTANANGAATITASSFGLLPTSQPVQVLAATIAFSPVSATITGTATRVLSLTLSTLAPAGGFTVNISSSNTSVATVPTTATFAANTTSASVPVTGVAAGTAVIHASALPNIADITSTITVVAPGSIALPASYSVGLFQTSTLPIILGTPAPAGGLTVTLLSSDTGKVTITPATLTFAAGSTTPTVTAQVYGASQGFSTITATAPGYTSASVQARTSDGIRINLPVAATVALGQSVAYPVILDQPAPAGGTTISFTSTDSTKVAVTATAFVPAGATTPTTQPLVTGLGTGSAMINASAANYTSASPQTVTVNATMSFTPATLSVSAPNALNATLTLSGPAPAAGLQINLLSSNSNAATVPNSVTFAGGATTVIVPITGNNAGVAAITATATAPNIPSTSASITVSASAGMIGLPSNIAVGLGQSVAFPITLPVAAPTGGVTVTLSSGDTTMATVTPSVFIAAGAVSPATQPQVNGLNLGSVNITASTANQSYSSAVQQVQVKATLSFNPNTINIAGTATQNLNLFLSGPAPTGGLTVNLSSNNTGVATVPSSLSIPAGTTSISVPVTGVAQANGTTGTAAITASTTAPNVPSTTATASVTSGLILGQINLTNVSVGQNLVNSLTISVSTAPVGADMPVTLTISDPAKALLAGRVGDAGASTVVASIHPGITTLNGIYVQGLLASGTVTITATANNYTAGTATVTLTPSGFVIAGPSGIGSSTFNVAQGVNSTVTVQPARLDSSLNFVEVQGVRPLFTTTVDPLTGQTQIQVLPVAATVNVRSSNTTVGTISASPVTFGPGAVSATTQFKPLTAGSTTLSVDVPSGFSAPAQDTSVTANVTATSVTATNVTVGKNLEAIASASLNGVTATDNTAVTVTSNTPGSLLLSTNATGVGSPFITLNIPKAGLTHTPDFYVYGLANSGSATYTVTIAGIGSATGIVTFQPSGVIVGGPSGFGWPTFLTSSAASPSTITVYSALLDATNNVIAPQALAGGVSAAVNVTSANTSVGTIITSPLTIAAGTNSATTQFQPVSAGTSVISIDIPAGFGTPAQDTSVTANVAVPGVAISDQVTVGKNLESLGQVSLGAPAPAGGVTINLTSNNSSALLLALNATDPGSTSISVTIPAGSTAANYYLQALQSTGSATYTSIATGYGTRTGTVNMAPSGVVIAGSVGFAPFFNASVAAGPTPLTVYMAQLDPLSNTYVIQQQLANNQGVAGVTVTLNDTNAAVGTVPTPVTIPVGANSIVVQFTPLTAGSTSISVVAPSGYTASANDTSLFGSVSQ